MLGELVSLYRKSTRALVCAACSRCSRESLLVIARSSNRNTMSGREYYIGGVVMAGAPVWSLPE